MDSIGRMRHLIVLQQKGVVARDGFGAETVTWSHEATAWAEANPYKLRQRLEYRRNMGEATIGLRVRTPFPASMGKRILFEGNYYNITEIDATNLGELLLVAVAEATTP